MKYNLLSMNEAELSFSPCHPGLLEEVSKEDNASFATHYTVETTT